MPAGGGMDFTYGQQNEVTGGPDAGDKSRPKARDTAATYKNQFMSESLSKKVVGISRVANFQQLKVLLLEFLGNLKKFYFFFLSF